MKKSGILFLLASVSAFAATPLTDVQMSGANNQVKSGGTLSILSGATLTIASGGTISGFTSGTNVLSGNGSGGFSNLTLSGLSLSSGTLSVASDAGLPSQTGNAGKFLTTNGTASSWGTLPLATTSVPGAVQPDGTTVDVAAGVISIPTATTSALGLVKPDGTSITISSGVISANSGAPTTSKYLLETADASLPNSFALGTLGTGLVKNTTTTGVPSIASAGTDYVAPGALTGSGLTMSTAKLIGRSTAGTGAPEEITVGSNLTLSGGTLSATGGFTNPMTTAGDIITGGTAGAAGRLGIGTSGQVLTVVSGAPAWAAATGGFSNPMTTLGDIITGGAAGAAGRLGVGSNGQVLTIVSGVPAWAAAGGGSASYSEQTLANTSAMALTTDTATAVTSLTLSAGDWLVGGAVSFDTGGSATYKYGWAGTSTTSASFINAYDYTSISNGTGTTVTVVQDIPCVMRHYSFASSTTVYLNARAGFTGSVNAYGRIWATQLPNFGAAGTVSSVGLSMPSGFSVSGSPVTGSGTLAVTTTLNGILKGNGSGFTTATSNTDYLPASGVTVSSGAFSGSAVSLTSTGSDLQLTGPATTGFVTSESNLKIDGHELKFWNSGSEKATFAWSSGGYIFFYDTAYNGDYLRGYDSGSKLCMLLNGGNLLIGSTTDNTNGKIQLPSATASSGGIAFGTDATIYRSGAGTLTVGGNLTVSGSSVIVGNGTGGVLGEIDFYTGASQRAAFSADPSFLTINSLTSNPLRLQTNGHTGLTLDASAIPNTTLAGNLTVSGTGTSSFASTTASTSTTTGALVVTGGVGIGGALNVGSNLVVYGNGGVFVPQSSTAPSASTTGTQLWSSRTTYVDSSRTVNNRIVDTVWGAGTFNMQFVDDAFTAGTSFLTATGGRAAGVSQVQLSAGSTATLAPGGLTLSGTLTVSGTGTSSFAGKLQANDTTDASNASTASLTTSGGLAVAKNLISGQGAGIGVTSTATAAGTTTLSSSSTQVQIFTGTTTQTITLPAANVFGANIGAVYRFKNRSTGALTINAAGTDTVEGSASATVASGGSLTLISDGSSEWEKF